MQFVVMSIFFLLQIYYLGFIYYYSLISLWGFRLNKRKDFKPIKSFALVVAAYNESSVVGSIVDNLKKLNYPRELYDIYVIADNCTDNTASIARQAEAIVYERFNDELRGKGYALKEFFEEYLFNLKKKYDAICIFDADNLVSKNFLLKMNNRLLEGNKVIQGYLDTKNPDDSWITVSSALAYWITSRAFQLARENLGLCAALGGTGFCVDYNTLKELGWNALSLTEDLEFSMKCVLKGITVHWEHEAKIYDEKPLTLKASIRQRIRWMQGHWDCAYRYTTALFRKAIKDRDIVALDAAFYLLQPSKVIANLFVLVMLFLKILFPEIWFSKIILPLWLLGISLGINYIIPILILIKEGVALKYILGLIPCYFYGLTWFPVTVMGWIKRKEKQWVHTIHTRSLTIEEIQNREGRDGGVDIEQSYQSI
ncbi:MAG: glycosyl transferase family 2 [Caloramator sp.]|nr:MAG: glycosyl transferase family 2 [Caloramator sp.]